MLYINIYYNAVVIYLPKKCRPYKKPYSLTPVNFLFGVSDIQTNVLKRRAHVFFMTRANMKDVGENLRPKTFLTKSIVLAGGLGWPRRRSR